VAYKYGVKNIMAWSYLGTAYMSWGKSERPEKVWQELIKAFLKIRSASGELQEDQ
jgi:tRNA U38,U39,U40 pseudouridine synthase TruA